MKEILLEIMNLIIIKFEVMSKRDLEKNISCHFNRIKKILSDCSEEQGNFNLYGCEREFDEDSKSNLNDSKSNIEELGLIENNLNEKRNESERLEERCELLEKDKNRLEVLIQNLEEEMNILKGNFDDLQEQTFNKDDYLKDLEDENEELSKKANQLQAFAFYLEKENRSNLEMIANLKHS